LLRGSRKGARRTISAKPDVLVNANFQRAANIPVLDGLRGLAALIVVVSHFSNEYRLWNAMLGEGAGQTGVMLFFILSGFLMAYLHIRQEFVGATVADYGRRRFARVYPMFVITAAILPMQELFAGQAVNTWEVVVRYLRQILLIDPGVSIFWTIRVEILFYVLFVGIWFVHKRLSNHWVSIFLLSVCIFGLSTFGISEDSAFFKTLRYFLFGVVSALCYPGQLGMPAKVVSVLAVISLLGLPLTFPHVWTAITGGEISPWKSAFVAVQCVLVFNLALRDRHLVRAMLGSAGGAWLGRISYSLYLLHPFVVSLVILLLGRNANLPLAFCAVLLISLAAATLSNHFIERPLQKFFLRWHAAPASLDQRTT
jgi:peptidoglycan/LPS O-acetylase OafA/YrhL